MSIALFEEYWSLKRNRKGEKSSSVLKPVSKRCSDAWNYRKEIDPCNNA